MIRAPIGDALHWNKWVEYGANRLAKEWESIRSPSQNPIYDPQYTFDTAKNHLRHILRRYSRGDPIAELDQHFSGMLDAWELSNRLSDDICREHNLKSCRDWTFDLGNLNHYNWCFWLVALALLLEVPDEQWQRLLALVDGEGRDELLDRVIATRTPARPIGTTLLHPKPYARLLEAIKAPEGERSTLLKEFVTHWYAELARRGSDELWWYIYGDPIKHPLSMGSYFGRWCLEAAAAAKMFTLDDSACLGHEHYPGDFLHPEGSSAKPEIARMDAASGWLKRLLKRR